MIKMNFFIVCSLVLFVAGTQGASLDANRRLLRKVEAVLDQMNRGDASDPETISFETAETKTEENRDNDEELQVEMSVEEDPAWKRALPTEKRGLGQTFKNYTCHKGAEDHIQSLEHASMTAHCLCRQRHDIYGADGGCDLEWDEGLASEAEAHAKWMADNDLMQHSSGSVLSAGNQGENLCKRALSVGPYLSGPSACVFAWYHEIDNWDFNTCQAADSGKAWGHFTAMMWKGVKKIGCGLSLLEVDNWDKTYFACRYWPAPNMQGQYCDNVMPVHTGFNPIAAQAELDPDGHCDFFAKCQKYSAYCSQIGSACDLTC